MYPRQTPNNSTPKQISPNATLNYFVDGQLSTNNPNLEARRIQNLDIYEATDFQDPTDIIAHGVQAQQKAMQG